ncbi:NADH:flavorubredoxin oxidoreductase [Photobacterium jeanii]|uniref:NADH:flavorubredoxin oxidoreductase n=1 Tax=Photobacterium jeanii TaxID=858640 RepID=A0A178KMI1_9GAMM|nr:NADH:flavorubredoxin reductase NorW [Photobacterium jeanii]OAN18400.1 NADH:flavorubredoxin oxidoreductase [Photobacterium jeanii]PST91919.1 NADH:flavorubredoxin reductase NorW [Photobacterium jeanii]
MNEQLIIIGSGFAAYQLVKSIRKIDQHSPITVITADSGDDYTKPDLSHVFSRQQTASDLIKQSAQTFAEANNINLLTHSRVDAIEPSNKQVHIGERTLSYSKLVLATGAAPFVPPFQGNGTEEIITLNSLMEYQQHQDKIAAAKSLLILGAGLIGTEIAMDLATAGKKVTLSDKATHLMPSLLSPTISSTLFQTLVEGDITLKLGTTVSSIHRHHQQLIAEFEDKSLVEYDVVIAAMGLKPNLELAKQAGITTQQGIVVDSTLQTSAPDIYALGDCAEFDGKIRAYLQPAMLSAMALAKTLTGTITQVVLPPSLIKVKTPWLPLSLAGDTSNPTAKWEITTDANGMMAKAIDPESNQLLGFIVSHDQQKNAFPLLRQLS